MVRPGASDSPIVVAIHGSEYGSDALVLGRLLGRLTGAPLLLASVYAYGDPRRVEAVLAASAREAEADCEVSTVALRDAWIARALKNLALDTAAAAVVVGSTPRGTLGRVAPGSVADGLLTTGRFPVAVAPLGYSSIGRPRLRRVGAAFVDATEGWDPLLVAQRLAEASGSELRVFGAVAGAPWTGTPGRGARRLRGALLERARSCALNAAESLHGAKVERKVIEGPPGNTLAKASRRLDLFVAGSAGSGTRTWTPLTGALCPVLAVPPRRATPLLDELERRVARAAA